MDAGPAPAASAMESVSTASAFAFKTAKSVAGTRPASCVSAVDELESADCGGENTPYDAPAEDANCPVPTPRPSSDVPLTTAVAMPLAAAFCAVRCSAASDASVRRLCACGAAVALTGCGNAGRAAGNGTAISIGGCDALCAFAAFAAACFFSEPSSGPVSCLTGLLTLSEPSNPVPGVVAEAAPTAFASRCIHPAWLSLNRAIDASVASVSGAAGKDCCTALAGNRVAACGAPGCGLSTLPGFVSSPNAAMIDCQLDWKVPVPADLESEPAGEPGACCAPAGSTCGPPATAAPTPNATVMSENSAHSVPNPDRTG